MRKGYQIKWRKSDSQELAKAVRKFNAKRTRLIKQVPELEDFLPDKLSVKEIRRNTKTRQDFNNTLRSINRFMKKGAEKPIVTEGGVKTTQYELRELSIKVRTINRRRAAERKAANVSTYKGTMGTIQANNLLPKRTDLRNISARDWQMFVESVEKQSRASYQEEKRQKYKKNFITALQHAFGSLADPLIELVAGIPPDVLAQAYYDNPTLQIDFVYDPLEAELIVEVIEEELRALVGG